MRTSRSSELKGGQWQWRLNRKITGRGATYWSRPLERQVHFVKTFTSGRSVPHSAPGKSPATTPPYPKCRNMRRTAAPAFRSPELHSTLEGKSNHGWPRMNTDTQQVVFTEILLQGMNPNSCANPCESVTIRGALSLQFPSQAQRLPTAGHRNSTSASHSSRPAPVMRVRSTSRLPAAS